MFYVLYQRNAQQFVEKFLWVQLLHRPGYLQHVVILFYVRQQKRLLQGRAAERPVAEEPYFAMLCYILIVSDEQAVLPEEVVTQVLDRTSTRLNSSH